MPSALAPTFFAFKRPPKSPSVLLQIVLTREKERDRERERERDRERDGSE